ncbi:MAG: hypothetical protein GY838_00185 [bacterium]|nr:hypothetical protein [bacterium]
MDPFLDEPQQSGSGLNLGMLWRAFWRRKLLFIVPFLLCLSMAAVVIKTMDPIYASSGQIEVKIDRYRSRLLNDPSQGYASRRNVGREILNDMANLLTSPKFLQAAARDLGMDMEAKAQSLAATGEEIDDETASFRAASRLHRMVRIDGRSESIYTLSVRAADPREAHRVATGVMTRFITEYRLARMAARNATRDFLEAQRTRYQGVLAASEAELNEFLSLEASSGMVGGRIHAGNVVDTEARLARVSERHEGADALEFNQLATQARRILGANPPVNAYANDSNIRSLLGELEDLGVELMATPDNISAYGDLEVRLGRLRVRMNSHVDELVAANHPGVGLLDRSRLTQYYYSYLHRSVELQIMRTVEQDLRDYRRFVTQQPMQSARLAELQGAVDDARQLVSTIQDEITQQQMNLEAGMSDVGLQISARQQPVMRAAPVEPDMGKLAIMGFVLSVGLGGGLVALAILLDRSFRSVEDIERQLGIKVIGTLPLIQDDHFIRKRRLRLLRWATIVLAVLAVAAVGFLVVYPMLNM